MPISIKRILRSGLEKFLRDRSSTGAALVVMTIALFLISSLYILQGMSVFLVEKLQEGVDVSAYFQDFALEEEIGEVRGRLAALEEVKEIEYVSKEEALRRFIESYEGDETILAPLDALGQNPLRAHINVKARDPNEYAKITELLLEDSFASIVADVDFYDRAPIIEKIMFLTSSIRALVLGVIIALSAISVLVAFNTIRLTVYNSKEEIEIMRLVGASSWFIQGPFLVQGVLVGAVSSAVTLVAVFGLNFFVGSKLQAFTGFNISSFLIENFFWLLLLGLVCGIGLGVLSSGIAIRKYLKA